MAGGLAALLDDVAAIAKVAASNVDDVALAAGKTSAKAAGVVVDDTAVTPQYVQGVTPARELPIIWRIAKGSFFNKLILILPVALLLSWLAPWALMPILMLGGSYLCFEGAEKIIEFFSKKDEHEPVVAKHEEAAEDAPDEDKLVRGAITTDLILSAEIMVISLNGVAHYPFWERTIVLAVVAILITVLVYGFVGLLVKMDDIGLHLSHRKLGSTRAFGRGLVKAMPIVLNVISVVGTFAMLWVGGHIMLMGMYELGFHQPMDLVHEVEHMVEAGGGFVVWLAETLCSLIFGLVWGLIIVGIVHLLPFGKKHH